MKNSKSLVGNNYPDRLEISILFKITDVKF